MGGAFDLPTQVTIGNHNASDCHLNHAGFIWVSYHSFTFDFHSLSFFPFYPIQKFKAMAKLAQERESISVEKKWNCQLSRNKI